MPPSNVTNNLYKLIDNALGRQLPDHVQSMTLELNVDSPPIITVKFIPDHMNHKVNPEIITKQFEIEEIKNAGRRNSKRNSGSPKKRTGNEKKHTKIDIVGDPPHKQAR